MSVDTNMKGKNLVPYRKVREGDLRILVAPQLSGIVSRLRIDVAGRRKKLAVSLEA